MTTGGRLLVGPEELVFETDRAGEPAATTNLIGITACGRTTPTRGRYGVSGPGTWTESSASPYAYRPGTACNGFPFQLPPCP